MNILVAIPSLGDGGAQRAAATLSDCWVRLGHEVTVVLQQRMEGEYPLHEAVRVVVPGGDKAALAAYSAARRVSVLRKTVDALSPDVMVGFLGFGAWVYWRCLGMGFPKVATMRNLPYAGESGKSARQILSVRGWQSFADATVFQCSRQRQLWKQSLRKAAVIPNPVPERLFHLPKGVIRPSCRRVYMSGRLTEQKDYPTAIRAMKQVLRVFPDASLDIYGQGAQRAALEGMVLDLGLSEKIRFMGWTNNLAEIRADYDLYILSSIFEGMPNALMEALAAGVPCVACDCDTGPGELIADGKTGLLVPTGDPDALSEAVIKLMASDAAYRQTMAAAARERMKRCFGEERIARSWLELFESIRR